MEDVPRKASFDVFVETWDLPSPLNCPSKSCGIDFNSIPNLQIHLLIKIESQNVTSDLQPCVKNNRKEGDTEDVEELEEAEQPHPGVQDPWTLACQACQA